MRSAEGVRAGAERGMLELILFFKTCGACGSGWSKASGLPDVLMVALSLKNLSLMTSPLSKLIFFAANFDYVPASGSHGDIVTDWDQAMHSSLTNTLTVSLLSCISEHFLTLTDQSCLSAMIQCFSLTTKQHQPAYKPQK